MKVNGSGASMFVIPNNMNMCNVCNGNPCMCMSISKGPRNKYDYKIAKLNKPNIDIRFMDLLDKFMDKNKTISEIDAMHFFNYTTGGYNQDLDLKKKYIDALSLPKNEDKLFAVLENFGHRRRYRRKSRSSKSKKRSKKQKNKMSSKI
jgi:hypothetical protein